MQGHAAGSCDLGEGWALREWKALPGGSGLESWSARREKTEAVSSEDDTLDSPVILEAPPRPLAPSPCPFLQSPSRLLQSDRKCAGVGEAGQAELWFPGPLGPIKTAVFAKAQNPSPSVCHLLAPAYLLWGHLSATSLHASLFFFLVEFIREI